MMPEYRYIRSKLCLMGNFHRHFFLFAVKLFVLLASFHAPVSAQENLGFEIVSDEEFKTLLLQNSSITVPIGLGCNRAGIENTTLPVHCFYENIEVTIDDLPKGGLNPLAVLEQIEQDVEWRKVSGDTAIDLVDWAVRPKFYWREDVDGKKALCVHGQPLESEYKDVVDCLVLSSFDGSEHRVLRQSFQDFGLFQLLADNLHRDPRRLRLFVMNFIASTEVGPLGK